MILLITPDCFNRTTNENDFFKFEIMEAVNFNCKIIPIMFYSSIPPQIPKDDEEFMKICTKLLEDSLLIYFDCEHSDSCNKINELNYTSLFSCHTIKK